MKRITVFADRPVGRIKPLHGVGGGPVTDNFSCDATDAFRAAGIPFCRTHDIEYPFGAGEYIDIHCLFPDFDRDVNDPTAYNFALTDLYVQRIVEAGARPFFRLGSSIEHQPVKRYIYPPRDFEKWADVCSHVIAHFNEGWNGGSRLGIEYWEIWNEPDNRGACYVGSDGDMFRLYDITAKKLKAEHPDIKIGGLAFTCPMNPMAESFLAHVRESGAPLDFFSWHGYSTTPEQSAHYADVASSLLDKYGFDGTESIYNEWNYVADWDSTLYLSYAAHKTAFCGAYIAGVLSALQNTRVDASMYYGVHSIKSPWNGLFSQTPETSHAQRHGVTVEPPYYALMYWNELYRRGTQVAVSADPNLYVTAARDGDGVTVLISYYGDKDLFGRTSPHDTDIAVDLAGFTAARATVRVTDADGTDRTYASDGKTVFMKGNSFALIRYE